MDRRQRRTRREIASVVGIAEDEFAGFDQMDRVGAAQRLVGAADHRLGNAVDEAEGLALRAELIHRGGILVGQLAERNRSHRSVPMSFEAGDR